MDHTEDDRWLIFSMLGALLDYPEPLLIDALPEIRDTMMRERIFPPDTRAALMALIDWMAARPLLALQEEHVETFGRGRATSLYLFEHVHGESRERGPAMIDLLAMYEAKGLFLGPGELPDYLPVFLEFLGQESPAQARTLLIEIAGIARQIAAKLAERGSAYAAAVAALLPLAGEPPLDAAAASTPSADGVRLAAETDGAALDLEWQDQPVDFLGAPAPASGPGRPVRFYLKRPPRS
ncbi:MAG: narJ [Herbaspirillum sp.]|jgi:nitrate reductase delta subunit|nr:narJ [Herbaspirillum sp.]